MNGEWTMAYGHAERNLALLRQLEAETGQLLESLDQPDPEQSAWLQEVASRGEVTGSLERATTDRSGKRTLFAERPVAFLVANGRTPRPSGPCPKCSRAADTAPPGSKA
jgi:hypothetical protein